MRSDQCVSRRLSVQTIDLPIGIDVFAECRIMATINRTVMIGHGTQIIMAWIVASSHRQGHVITYVKLIDRKSYVILYLFTRSHRCVEIEFKSAMKRKKKCVLVIEFIESIPKKLNAYRLRWTANTGGTFEMSNFLMASRSFLQIGQNQPLIFSPSKYMSMHSFRSLCLLCCGSSKLKFEKPS